ncbi:MAG: prepilin-type N-terminal cleavage/methylation domain-containing protein [Oligoflexus sp.]
MMPMKMENGFSLIEMMLTLGIAGVLMLGAVRYFENLNKMDIRHSSQKNTKDMMTIYKKRIERDFQYKLPEASSVVIKDNGRTLTIKRFRAYDSGAVYNESFDVTYESVCARPSQQYADALNTIYRKHSEKIHHADNKCLSSFTCPRNSYHQIRITTSAIGDRIQTYDPRYFPDFHNEGLSIAASPIGAGLCLRRSGDQYHVRLEAFYLIEAAESSSQVNVLHDDLYVDTFRKNAFLTLPE